MESFDEVSIKQNLQSEISRKKELDAKLSQVDKEINSLHQQSSQQAELELHQNSLQEKEKNIAFLKTKHKSNLEVLFNNKEVPQTKLKDHLDKVQKSLVCI